MLQCLPSPFFGASDGWSTSSFQNALNYLSFLIGDSTRPGGQNRAIGIAATDSDLLDDGTWTYPLTPIRPAANTGEDGPAIFFDNGLVSCPSDLARPCPT